jgi:hypothetical protein
MPPADRVQRAAGGRHANRLGCRGLVPAFTPPAVLVFFGATATAREVTDYK